MSFGARLREERRRLGFRQSEFAALVGTDVPKQSLYENDHRQLRAGYLERAEALGVDLLYVLTGLRSEDALGEGASGFLTDYLSLPEFLRETVKRYIGKLRDADREQH
jgi:transcriptional regulator with XRE-family HTH domain